MKRITGISNTVKLMAIAGFASALAVTGAQAQSDSTSTKVDIKAWSDSMPAGGWRARSLLGVAVKGEGGDDLGDIRNIVVGPNGQIQSVIVEAGGFLDIGDTHFDVPWDQVQVADDMESVTVPVNEDNFNEFNLFGDSYQTEISERDWKVTELLDDYVSLTDRADYGYVDDVIFDADGQLTTVVVTPDVAYGTRGYYGYPYYGYNDGFQPGMDRYELPFDSVEIQELAPINLDNEAM